MSAVSGDLTVRLTVRARPRAKTSGITRAEGLLAHVSVAAPPTDGLVNDELVALVARALSVPRKAVRLAHGAASKNKVVEVCGLSAAEVIERLARAVAGERL